MHLRNNQLVQSKLLAGFPSFSTANRRKWSHLCLQVLQEGLQQQQEPDVPLEGSPAKAGSSKRGAQMLPVHAITNTTQTLLAASRHHQRALNEQISAVCSCTGEEGHCPWQTWDAANAFGAHVLQSALLELVSASPSCPPPAAQEHESKSAAISKLRLQCS